MKILEDVVEQEVNAWQGSFAYELCPYPPAIFDHKLFQCSGVKYGLTNVIWRQVDREHIEKPAVVCPERETDALLLTRPE